MGSSSAFGECTDGGWRFESESVKYYFEIVGHFGVRVDVCWGFVFVVGERLGEERKIGFGFVGVFN